MGIHRIFCNFFHRLIRKIFNEPKWLSIISLTAYKKTKTCQDLESALRSYNKALGSSLSLKKIIAISQYVKEAYKIGNEEEIKELNAQVDKTVNSLKSTNISEIDDNLVALSNFKRNDNRPWESPRLST